MLIAGNWKMHLTRAEAESLCTKLESAKLSPGVCQVVAPSYTLLPLLSAAFTGLSFAAQDCHAHPQGAHTGDVSAAMLREAGASFVILGHSERRTDHLETDAQIAAKVSAALSVGLEPILCVGESLAEREAGKAEIIVTRQLDAVWQLGVKAVAYEPVWAIGTGLTPTNEEIAAMHAVIHTATSQETEVLYGGSVKAANAAEILATPGVDGVLVGGASLKADDFLTILAAANDAVAAGSAKAKRA